MAALIENIQEIKAHNSAVSIQMELSGVKSFIDDGIDNYILPAVGRGCFDALISAKGSFSDIQAPAFNYLQKSGVGFMLAYYSVSGAVQIDSAGIYVLKSGNNVPASDKKLLALRKDSFEKGYNSLEMAINYIEDNINSFPEYKESNEHKRNRAMFINRAIEFQESGVNIANSSQMYSVLRTYQDDAERTYINPLLGEDLNQIIRAAILNGSASDIQTQLLKELQRPLASFTMMEAIPYVAISVTPDGIFQLSESVGGMAANVETKSSAGEIRLQHAMYGLQAKGDRQLETLRKWLAKHKADFSDYVVPTEVNINDDPNSNIYYI